MTMVRIQKVYIYSDINRNYERGFVKGAVKDYNSKLVFTLPEKCRSVGHLVNFYSLLVFPFLTRKKPHTQPIKSSQYSLRCSL